MARVRFTGKRTNTTGFGAQASNQGERLVNADGTYNVKREGIAFFNRFNHFHDLITMKWWKFFALVFSFYTTINILFACLFLAAGMDQLDGDLGLTLNEQFWDAFFFSSQTLTTVGYGRTNPIGFTANVIAAFECLLGLMTFAIMTGVLYARFARPRAKLIYSNQALISPYQSGNALMLRIANGRTNQIIECEAQLLMSYIDKTTNRREFEPLALEYAKVSALALSWTIVHPIIEDSPMFGLTQADLDEIDAEFILLFKAFDETYAQTIHARHSYASHQLVWGAKFDLMYHRANNQSSTVLSLDKIGSYHLVDSIPKAASQA